MDSWKNRPVPPRYSLYVVILREKELNLHLSLAEIQHLDRKRLEAGLDQVEFVVESFHGPLKSSHPFQKVKSSGHGTGDDDSIMLVSGLGHQIHRTGQSLESVQVKYDIVAVEVDVFLDKSAMDTEASFVKHLHKHHVQFLDGPQHGVVVEFDQVLKEIKHFLSFDRKSFLVYFLQDVIVVIDVVQPREGDFEALVVFALHAGPQDVVQKDSKVILDLLLCKLLVLEQCVPHIIQNSLPSI